MQQFKTGGPLLFLYFETDSITVAVWKMLIFSHCHQVVCCILNPEKLYRSHHHVATWSVTESSLNIEIQLPDLYDKNSNHIDQIIKNAAGQLLRC